MPKNGGVSTDIAVALRQTSDTEESQFRSFEVSRPGDLASSQPVGRVEANQIWLFLQEKHNKATTNYNVNHHFSLVQRSQSESTKNVPIDL